MTEGPSVLEPLTGREADVLACLAEGLSNNEIAERLFLSPNTVKWYVRQLNSKLDTSNRDEIVTRARAFGLLDTDKPELVAAKHNLPYQTTPFIGRDAELDELARILANPDVRLLTILAPGGMGKTRLALEAAEQQLYNFQHGVYFVPLQPLAEVEQITPAVAQHLGFQFMEDARPPKQQLLDYFGSKKMLLVLDNWEHLLDGAPLISEILQAAPDVKVLATSREKLNLSGETVYGLRGMQFPTWETPEDALQYDAVKLLVQAAKRVRPDFAVTAENLDYVARVCRLTEGMPLGILLATGWLDALSLERIADEIQKSVDFLETEMRDVPERQRSIRAVFESAWERLAPADQQVFMKLSVFRGGCTPEAAEALTGAKLRTLQTLVNKALLLRTKAGRYDIHELLRQYGYARLEASGTLADVLRQHSITFADFLHQREDDLKGRRQLEAIEEIEAELDNIRQSWYQALQHEDMALIEQSSFSLESYVIFRSRELEFIPLFADAEAALRSKYAAHRGYGRLLAHYGRVMNWLVRYQESERLLRQALMIAQAQDDRKGTAYSALELARAIFELGKRDEAWQLCDESIRMNESLADDYELADALFYKSSLLGISGKNNEALALARQTLEMRRRLGDERGMTFSLTNIAVMSGLAGQIDEFEILTREALALSRRLNRPSGVAWSLGELGLVEFEKGNVEAARHYWTEALQMGREIAFANITAMSLIDLARIDIVLDHFDEAEQKGEEAMSLGIARAYSHYLLVRGLARLGLRDWVGAKQALVEYFRQPLDANSGPIPMGMVGMGFIIAEQGQTEHGLELASLALNHLNMPMSIVNSPLVSRHLEAIKGKLTEEAYAAAWERGKMLDLKATVTELIEEYGKDTPQL